MYGFYYNNFGRILIKSFIVSFILTPIFIGMLYLVSLNYNLSYYICKVLNIPSDLSFTTMSPGFACDMLVLQLVFEFVIFVYLYEKISKAKIYNNIYNLIANI